MTQRCSQSGIAMPMVIASGLLIIVVVGTGYYLMNKPQVDKTTSETDEIVAERTDFLNEGSKQIKQTQDDAPSGSAQFTGTVLAGSSAPLLDFNQADFNAAKTSGKLVVLYFYADWCPICREEFPIMQAAFNEVSTSDVVGFRVNYNDRATDDAEKALAREHGIAYQHTKVFIKGSQRLLKSPETWEQNRYTREINAAL